MEKQAYEKKEDTQLNIVLFDIPEPERKKREWLRQELNYLGFTMLQRSVWAGKIKIPKEMLEDLEHYKLLPYIEIIAVTKTGTLKKLI
ncbi:MAG: CRISPR-associated endonuclease Cas2 [Parcubacteria group bacterium]|nr:CRISPR-associated endonuclease Cas2 [Parcubacteria group bacterium]